MADQGKKKTSQAAEPPKDAPARKGPAAPVYVGGETLADRLMPHMKKIIGGVIVLALVITGFYTWKWWRTRKAERATDNVLAAFDESSKRVTAPVTDDGGIPSQPDDTYATRADRANAALTNLAKISGDQQRQGVGLFEADQLLEAGRFDDAAAAYRKLSDKPGIDGVLAREGLGFALEAKADAADGDKTAGYADALAAFQAMQPDDAGPRRDYALYNVGRLQEKTGAKDDARASYQSALDKAKDAGDSDLEDTINTRLVLIDQPPLPPPPPAAPAGAGSGSGSGSGSASGSATTPASKPATTPATKPATAPAPKPATKPAAAASGSASGSGSGTSQPPNLPTSQPNK